MPLRRRDGQGIGGYSRSEHAAKFSDPDWLMVGIGGGELSKSVDRLRDVVVDQLTEQHGELWCGGTLARWRRMVCFAGREC